MRVSVVLLVCLSLLSPVRAEIYRCVGDSGEPSFTHLPCAQGSTLKVPPAAAAGGAGSGLRPAEQAWLAERERERRPARTARPRAEPAKHRNKARVQAYRCRSKRRSLDEVRARLRRGYKPAQGEKLRNRRRAYEDYLATYCS